MKRSLKFLGCFIIICVLGIYYSTISNAAIEIKPGTAPHTGINVSTCYQYCYDMRSSTSTLGVNSLDPHLTLNADWGAVAYLGASTYGSIRGKGGTYLTLGHSTTNNITGVMDMGPDGYNKNTFTSSLIEGYTENEYITNLEKNINTKYVEKLPTENTINGTKGLALAETAGWYGSKQAYGSNSEIVFHRSGSSIFGFGSECTHWPSSRDGEADSDTTYRPVIWN